MIDMVWLQNGYRYDLGWPHFVRLLDEDGGLLSLTVRGKSLNTELDRENQTIHLWGNLVNQRPSCRTIKTPVGETVQLPYKCANGRTNRSHNQGG